MEIAIVFTTCKSPRKFIKAVHSNIVPVKGDIVCIDDINYIVIDRVIQYSPNSIGIELKPIAEV